MPCCRQGSPPPSARAHGVWGRGVGARVGGRVGGRAGGGGSGAMRGAMRGHGRGANPHKPAPPPPHARITPPTPGARSHAARAWRMDETRPSAHSASRCSGEREKASAMRESARQALSTIFASCGARGRVGGWGWGWEGEGGRGGQAQQVAGGHVPPLANSRTHTCAPAAHPPPSPTRPPPVPLAHPPPLLSAPGTGGG